MSMFENPGIQNTTSSPIGNFPELWKMTDFNRGGSLSGANAGVMGRKASAEAAYEEQSANYNRSNRIAELKAMLDPKNFQRVQKEDGGYDYFDPTGQKITVEDYAKYTDTTKEKALEGSTSYQDINFLRDYNTAKELMKAVVERDQTKIVEIQTQLESAGVDPNKIVPKDLMRALYEQYGEYWETTDERKKKEMEKASQPDFFDKLSGFFAGSSGE